MLAFPSLSLSSSSLFPPYYLSVGQRAKIQPGRYINHLPSGEIEVRRMLRMIVVCDLVVLLAIVGWLGWVGHCRLSVLDDDRNTLKM